MQMVLFPRGWPPLFSAGVCQGRFLCSIKEGVAFFFLNKSAPSAVTVGPLQDCLSPKVVLFPILLVADIFGRMSAPQSQAFTTAVGGMPP